MIKIRKIETKEDRERKEKRNKVVLGIILVVIMVLSTAGYAFFGRENTESQEGKVRYNNLDFYLRGNLWEVDISGTKFYFHYLPNETRMISIKKTLRDYQGKTLYFTRDEIAEQEIAGNLKNFVSRINPNPVCLPDTNCTEDSPEKNCTDNIIIIQERDFANVAEEDNCVFIFSNDTLKDADAFLYKILGVV